MIKIIMVVFVISCLFLANSVSAMVYTYSRSSIFIILPGAIAKILGIHAEFISTELCWKFLGDLNYPNFIKSVVCGS